MEANLDERKESIDIFFEGLSLSDETDTRKPRIRFSKSPSVRLKITIRFTG